MLDKRSTRSIVTSKRPTEENSDAEAKVAGRPLSPSGTVPSAEVQEALPVQEPAPGAPEEKAAMKKLPKWIICVCAALVLVIIASLSLLGGSDTTVAPVIAQTQSIIAVDADIALATEAQPGDVVRLYSVDGQPIESLQYVQVYSTNTDGQLLLLVDDIQAAVMVSQELNPKVILVAHNDPDQAGELLDLQTRINNPEIALGLEPVITLTPGEAAQPEFQTSITPIEATLPEVQWISSDPAVATVENGTVTAQGIGQTTITVTCGDAQAECVVTVEVPMEAVTLSQAEAVVGVGETLPLSAAALPEGASLGEVSWTTADAGIATVSEDGTVTAVAIGSTTITASSGSYSASCTVTVGVHAELAQVDKSSLTLTVGQTDYLAGTVYPISNVIDGMYFESSDSEVATVAEDGTVTAVAPGTCIITFRCGNAEATCPVVVSKPED